MCEGCGSYRYNATDDGVGTWLDACCFRLADQDGPSFCPNSLIFFIPTLKNVIDIDIWQGLTNYVHPYYVSDHPTILDPEGCVKDWGQPDKI